MRSVCATVQLVFLEREAASAGTWTLLQWRCNTYSKLSDITEVRVWLKNSNSAKIVKDLCVTWTLAPSVSQSDPLVMSGVKKLKQCLWQHSAWGYIRGLYYCGDVNFFFHHMSRSKQNYNPSAHSAQPRLKSSKLSGRESSFHHSHFLITCTWHA